VDGGPAALAVPARLAAVLLPEVPGDVFTLADAGRSGATRRQLEWAVRAGRLHRVQPGVFCPQPLWSAATPEQRTVLRAHAHALKHPGSVFSHGTAAALLGLPAGDDGLVRVTGAPGARTGRESGVVRYAAPLPDGDVMEVNGVLCTSPARTVLDCLRHLDAMTAVPVGDVALRGRTVTVEQLAARLEVLRWPRAAAADELLSLLDGRRESPLESRSAVVFHRYGLPRPAVQVRILDAAGRFIGRPDMVWLEHGVAGEADGLVKYDGGAAVVSDERVRQARLQAVGLVVVRWTEQQLHGTPPLVVQQLRPALADGNGRRFRGRVA
jgi:hypothetical protein